MLFSSINSRFILNNSYIGCEQIGRGAQAIIYKGKCLKTGKKITIKSKKKDKILDCDESYILKKLSKRGGGIYTPKFIDVIHDEYDVEHIITEYIPGKDLFDWHDEMNFKPLFKSKEVKKIFSGILGCIEFCHSHNIAHLDLKPENIIMQNQNIPILIDFGCSKVCNQRINKSNQMLGTELYCSPETMKDYFHLKSDVWSFGLIMHIILTGFLPYKKPVKKNKFLDDKAIDLINLMLSENIEYRPNIREILDHDYFKS